MKTIIILFTFFNAISVYAQDIQFRLNCNDQSCGFSLKNSDDDTVFRVNGNGSWFWKMPDFVSGTLFYVRYRGSDLFNISGSPSINSTTFRTPLYVILPSSYNNLSAFEVMRGNTNDRGFRIELGSTGWQTEIFGRMKVSQIRPLEGDTAIEFLDGIARFTQPVRLLAGGCYINYWQQCSDINLKKNIRPIGNALNKILNLNGVLFDWRREDFPQFKLDEGSKIGFIAQDVEKIFPELVKTESDGLKSIAYSNLNAVLVEAIKEQQKIIDEQKEEINLLSSEIRDIKTELMNLKSEIDKLSNH